MHHNSFFSTLDVRKSINFAANTSATKVPANKAIAIAQNSFVIISIWVIIPIAAGINKSGKYLRCKATALSRLIKLPFLINKKTKTDSLEF